MLRWRRASTMHARPPFMAPGNQAWVSLYTLAYTREVSAESGLLNPSLENINFPSLRGWKLARPRIVLLKRDNSLSAVFSCKRAPAGNFYAHLWIMIIAIFMPLRLNAFCNYFNACSVYLSLPQNRPSWIIFLQKINKQINKLMKESRPWLATHQKLSLF